MYRTLLLLLCISTSIASEQFCCKDGLIGHKTTFSKDDKTTSDFWGSQYAPHTPDMAEAFCRELHAKNKYLKISQFFYRGACDAPAMPPHNYPPEQTLLTQGSQFPIVNARKDDGGYCHEGAECNVATKTCHFTKNSIKCGWHRNQCVTVDVCGNEPVCWEIYNKWRDYNVNEWDCLNKDNCAGTFREHGTCCEDFTHTCYACKMCLSEEDYCKLPVQVRDEPGLGVPPGCYCYSGTVSIAGDTFSPCNRCQPGWGNGVGGNTPCAPCPAGTENPIEAGECTECPYPKLSASGALECVDATVLTCGEGQKWTPPTTTLDGSCAHCPAGSIGPELDDNGETAQTFCTICPHGSYADAQGLTECTVCPDDQTTTTGYPGVGSTDASDCTDCAATEDCRVRTTENGYTCRRERALAGACETTRSVSNQGSVFVAAEDGGREVSIDKCEADASTWVLPHCSITEGGRESNPVSCTAPASTWNDGFCNLLGPRNENQESCEISGLSWEFSSTMGYYCTKADDLSYHAPQFTSKEECEAGGSTWNTHFGVCADDRDIAPCSESNNGIWQPAYCTAAAIDAYEVMAEQGYCADGYGHIGMIGHDEHDYYSGMHNLPDGLDLEGCFDECLQAGQFDFFIHHTHSSANGDGNCYCGNTKERHECDLWYTHPDTHYYSYRIQRASDAAKLGYTTRTACETQGTWGTGYCTVSDYTTWQACETKGRWTGNEVNLGCRSTTAPKDDTGKNWCYIADVDHEAAGQNWDYCTVACPVGEEPVLVAETGSAWYECAACADGKKNNAYDDSSCTVCDTGEFTDDKETCTTCTETGAVTWMATLTGHITNDACQVATCAAGYKLVDHKCTACEAGEHSDEGSTTCDDDTADQNSCTATQHFVEGTDHTTDDAECEDDSTQQADCVAGEYFVPGTASSTENDSACEDCNANQYSAAGADSCTDDGKAAADDCDADQYFTVGTKKDEDDGACTDCTEPSASQYTSTICGSSATDKTADTVLGDCTAPSSGEYTSTVCTHGDSGTAGADTQFTSCTTCAAGKYTSVACAAGTKVLEGSDTECTACASGTAQSQTGQTSCTACTAGTNFASSAGASSCTNCAAPGTKKYVSSACTADADTQTDDCNEAGTGQYQSGACTQGSAGQTGDAGSVDSCTAPGAGEYVKTACAQGAWNSAGSDTDIETCGGDCQDGHAQTDCTAGNIAAAGSNTVCTQCAAGKYSTGGAACQACGANTYSAAGASACSAHTTCGNQVDGTTRLTSASATAAGSCADCASGSYAADATSNCQAHTSCGMQLDGSTSRLTSASTTQAGSCADCTSGHASDGTSNCAAWTSCGMQSDGSTSRLTGNTATAAGSCADCTGSTYAASGTANCQSHTSCGNQKNGNTRLSEATATTAGSCDACTVGWAAQGSDNCADHSTSCDTGKYISAAGTTTADITCQTCATCSGTKYASGGCTGSTNTICTERCSDGTSYATEAACLAAAGSCNDNSINSAAGCINNYVSGGACSDTNRGASESQCTITTADTGSPLASSDANYVTKATCETLRNAWQNPQSDDPAFEQSHQAAPAGCYMYDDSSSLYPFIEWNNQGGVDCGHNNIDCIQHTGNTWTQTTSARSWTSSNTYHSG